MGSSGHPDRIELRDVLLPCHIGIDPCERDHAQMLRLRLSVEVDLQNAGLQDDLQQAVDYVWLSELLREATRMGPYGLLESLALRILKAVLGDERIEAAEIELSKERCPLGEGFGPVAVILRRRRGELE